MSHYTVILLRAILATLALAAYAAPSLAQVDSTSQAEVEPTPPPLRPSSAPT